MPLDVSSAPPQTTPRETRLADYRPPAFLVDTVELGFELDEAATHVRSRLAVRRNPASSERDAPLALDGEALTLLRVALNGEDLGANRYRIEGEKLLIPDMPDAATVEIETRIAPKDNTELSGLYTSNGSYFTQCEAEGFRRITYFPDRPDVMARFTTTITADTARVPVMLSNGNPGPVEAVGDGRHRITWTDPHPKPCYLFALVAGDLVAVKDSFTTRSGRHVDLGIWVRRGDQDRCAHAMHSLKTAMKWDEDVFGLEYDLDVFNIAAVSDFNMGAMENKGLNVFNTKYVLARPETATDNDYQGIETVIAHEYFHNWTGNRVTCRDWFQLSLKEGLTVYRDQEFSADQGSRVVKRIADVRALRAAQFREDAGPLAHPVQPDHYITIDNFYTATVYNKGAEVIRMMATIIGREAFRRGMDLYFARHDNQAVTIDDFAQAMQDASGVDLTRFKRWYHQAGTPQVTVSDSYDAATRRYTLTLRQQTPPTPGQPDKQPLVIPVAMGLLDSDGGEIAARTLLLTEAEQSFAFDDVAAPPVPSLLRGFSAPVKLSGVPLAQLQFLAAHDTDPFVRWESAQQYATHLLLQMAAAWRRGESTSAGSRLDRRACGDLAQRRCRSRLRCRSAGVARRGIPRRPDGGGRCRCDPCRARQRARGDRRGVTRRAACHLRAADRHRPLSYRRRRDRPPRVAQCLPRVSRSRRQCRWHRSGQGAIRRRTEHDGRAGGARDIGGHRLPRAHRGTGGVPCALAHRRSGAGQVVRHPGDLAAARHPERCARAGEARRFRPAQPEPSACPGRQLRLRQPGPLPRTDRQRLSLPGRHHHRVGPDQHPGRRAPGAAARPMAPVRPLSSGADEAGTAAHPRHARSQQRHVRDGDAQHRLSAGTPSPSLRRTEHSLGRWNIAAGAISPVIDGG